MKPQQHKSGTIQSGAYRAFELMNKLTIVPCRVRCIYCYKLIMQFLYPEVIPMQPKVCQDNQAGNNHIPGAPGGIRSGTVIRIRDRPGLPVLYFQDKAHKKMEKHPESQYGLANILHQRIVPHKMRNIIE